MRHKNNAVGHPTYVCSTCHQSLPKEAFYTTCRGKLESRCKNCRRIDSNNRYARVRLEGLPKRIYRVITQIDDRDERINMIKRSLDKIAKRSGKKDNKKPNKPKKKGDKENPAN